MSDIFAQIDEMLIVMNGCEIIAWFFSCLVIAIFIGDCFIKITRSIQAELTIDIKLSKTIFPKNKWNHIVNIGKNLTKTIKDFGVMEITFFYICLFFNKPEGIGAWLVFKVAVKWESWTNIVKVPDTIKDGNKSINDFEYLEF
ncbi:MAG: hypothetical protein WC810_27380, partial [Janthinobacterium sp.]